MGKPNLDMRIQSGVLTMQIRIYGEYDHLLYKDDRIRDLEALATREFSADEFHQLVELLKIGKVLAQRASEATGNEQWKIFHYHEEDIVPRLIFCMTDMYKTTDEELRKAYLLTNMRGLASMREYKRLINKNTISEVFVSEVKTDKLHTPLSYAVYHNAPDIVRLFCELSDENTLKLKMVILSASGNVKEIEPIEYAKSNIKFHEGELAEEIVEILHAAIQGQIPPQPQPVGIEVNPAKASIEQICQGETEDHTSIKTLLTVYSEAILENNEDKVARLYQFVYGLFSLKTERSQTTRSGIAKQLLLDECPLTFDPLYVDEEVAQDLTIESLNERYVVDTSGAITFIPEESERPKLGDNSILLPQAEEIKISKFADVAELDVLPENDSCLLLPDESQPAENTCILIELRMVNLYRHLLTRLEAKEYLHFLDLDEQLYKMADALIWLTRCDYAFLNSEQGVNYLNSHIDIFHFVATQISQHRQLASLQIIEMLNKDEITQAQMLSTLDLIKRTRRDIYAAVLDKIKKINHKALSKLKGAIQKIDEYSNLRQDFVIPNQAELDFMERCNGLQISDDKKKVMQSEIMGYIQRNSLEGETRERFFTLMNGLITDADSKKQHPKSLAYQLLFDIDPISKEPLHWLYATDDDEPVISLANSEQNGYLSPAYFVAGKPHLNLDTFCHIYWSEDSALSVGRMSNAVNYAKNLAVIDVKDIPAGEDVMKWQLADNGSMAIDFSAANQYLAFHHAMQNNQLSGLLYRLDADYFSDTTYITWLFRIDPFYLYDEKGIARLNEYKDELLRLMDAIPHDATPRVSDLFENYSSPAVDFFITDKMIEDQIFQVKYPKNEIIDERMGPLLIGYCQRRLSLKQFELLEKFCLKLCEYKKCNTQFIYEQVSDYIKSHPEDAALLLKTAAFLYANNLLTQARESYDSYLGPAKLNLAEGDFQSIQRFCEPFGNFESAVITLTNTMFVIKKSKYDHSAISILLINFMMKLGTERREQVFSILFKIDHKLDLESNDALEVLSNAKVWWLISLLTRAGHLPAITDNFAARSAARLGRVVLDALVENARLDPSECARIFTVFLDMLDFHAGRLEINRSRACVNANQSFIHGLEFSSLFKQLDYAFDFPENKKFTFIEYLIVKERFSDAMHFITIACRQSRQKPGDRSVYAEMIKWLSIDALHSLLDSQANEMDFYFEELASSLPKTLQYCVRKRLRDKNYKNTFNDLKVLDMIARYDRKELVSILTEDSNGGDAKRLIANLFNQVIRNLTQERLQFATRLVALNAIVPVENDKLKFLSEHSNPTIAHYVYLDYVHKYHPDMINKVLVHSLFRCATNGMFDKDFLLHVFTLNKQQGLMIDAQEGLYVLSELLTATIENRLKVHVVLEICLNVVECCDLREAQKITVVHLLPLLNQLLDECDFPSQLLQLFNAFAYLYENSQKDNISREFVERLQRFKQLGESFADTQSHLVKMLQEYPGDGSANFLAPIVRTLINQRLPEATKSKALIKQCNALMSSNSLYFWRSKPPAQIKQLLASMAHGLESAEIRTYVLMKCHTILELRRPEHYETLKVGATQ